MDKVSTPSVTDTEINVSVTNLFKEIEFHMTASDMERIKDAYKFAREAHKNQKRKTGEPYIIHPIAVARIVAEDFKLGANPIIAAFLHDVAEDTSYTIDDIKDRFGDDVAFLVRVVTKTKKDHYEMSKQLDNFKQMLNSIHYDIRALLIKLADRLHNMRTLDSMNTDKQMKIAGETDYFYAPLANRLGLYEIKTEMENLSLRFRCPQEYKMLKDLLNSDELENCEQINELTDKISSMLLHKGIDCRVYARYRTPYSIWRKMKSTGRDFKHIDFRHVIHIVFPVVTNDTEKNRCLQIYSLLTDNFKEMPGGMKNYIDSPKENAYQSLHVKLLCEHGSWEEIHISSERMIYNSKMGCISDRTINGVDNWIKKFKSILRDIALHGKENNFIENVVTSFYNDDIMVFTPDGKGVILPKNASALDFAYEIHTSIGRHAQYARINGKLNSIKTTLHRGDCVEIGTNDSVHPRPDWLDHALTYKARRNIQYALRGAKKSPYQRCPSCNPLPGDEVVGFIGDDKNITIHKRDCHKAIILASKEGDSIINVNYTEDPDILYPASISIKAIDRYHLLKDLVNTITEDLNLSIDSLNTVTTDQIVDCTINFYVHSINELNTIIAHINAIKGVDEVKRNDTFK